MRISMVSFEYPPRIYGGAGVYAENLSVNLVRLGHQVTVYVPNIDRDTEVLDWKGVEVRRIRQRRNDLAGWFSFCLGVTKGFHAAYLKGDIDLVHLNTMGFFGFRDRKHGPPFVSTGHHLSVETAKKGNLRLVDRLQDLQGENGFIVPMAERYGVRFTDRYLAVSHETKRGLMRNFHVAEGAVDVIWNGVDGSAAPTGPQDREELRAKMGLPSGPLLLFVGRVDDPRKGLVSLLRSLAPLSDSAPRLVAVGGGSNAKAMEAAKQLGLQDRLIFLGKVPAAELWSSYLVADACVCASRQEGFGLTIAEAISAGCPVVSTNVGVAPELRDRLEAVVPTNDERAMTEALSSFLSRRRERGRMAEVRVPHELSWERCAQQTLASYQKAVEGRMGRGGKVG